MKKILEFLSTDGAFLYENYCFRIVDSEFIPTFGGTGSITLSNDTLDIKLELERENLYMNFQGGAKKSKAKWFSAGVVHQLLTGEIGDELIDHEYCSFLKLHWDEIQERFSEGSLSETEAVCKELEKQRAKRMFG